MSDPITSTECLFCSTVYAGKGPDECPVCALVSTNTSLAKDLAEARAKLRHVCEVMSTLGNPGLKDVLLEMHAYLFPEATAVRIAAQEKTL